MRRHWVKCFLEVDYIRWGFVASCAQSHFLPAVAPQTSYLNNLFPCESHTGSLAALSLLPSAANPGWLWALPSQQPLRVLCPASYHSSGGFTSLTQMIASLHSFGTAFSQTDLMTSVSLSTNSEFVLPTFTISGRMLEVPGALLCFSFPACGGDPSVSSHDLCCTFSISAALTKMSLPSLCCPTMVTQGLPSSRSSHNFPAQPWDIKPPHLLPHLGPRELPSHPESCT